VEIHQPVSDPPARDRADDRREAAALLRQRIELTRAVRDRLDESGRGQLAQPLREHARRDAGALAQLLEAAARAGQMAHEHERPAVADHVEAAPDRIEDRLGPRHLARLGSGMGDHFGHPGRYLSDTDTAGNMQLTSLAGSDSESAAARRPDPVAA